jgi:hypothetical protein
VGDETRDKHLKTLARVCHRFFVQDLGGPFQLNIRRATTNPRAKKKTNNAIAMSQK